MCFILCLLTFRSAIGQNHIVIRYQFTQTKEFADSSYFELFKPVSLNDLTFQETIPILKIVYEKKPDCRLTICTYALKDTSIVFIADGFNHELIAIPNDTIDVNVPDTTISKLNKDYLSPWMRSFSYKGKSKATSVLFDSLAYHTGAVHMDFINYNVSTFNATKFYDDVTKRYINRVNYITQFCKNNQIDNNIKFLVISEIKSAYVINLLLPLQSSEQPFPWNDLPADYKQTLNSLNINDEKSFFRNPLYHQAVYNSLLYAHDKTNLSTQKEQILVYNAIKAQAENPIKDYLLALHVSLLSYKQLSCFDSLLTDLHATLSSTFYLKAVDSLAKINKQKLNKFSITNALNSQISSPSGKTFELNEIFHGKPVVIDCWATWCAPCHYQLSFTKNLEKEYQGKADFIYLSFDKNKNAWQKEVNDDKSSGNYLLTQNFKSPFAGYFDIKSIPRYLIFNKDGQLINGNAPRPSRNEPIRKIIDKLL